MTEVGWNDGGKNLIAVDSRDTGRRVIKDTKYRIIFQRTSLQREVEEWGSNLIVNGARTKFFVI